MSSISAYEWLVAEMYDKEFGTYEEYVQEVKRVVSGIEEGLEKAEQWACQINADVFRQLGVSIKELEVD